MRAILALAALALAPDANAFGIGIPEPARVVEYHNTILGHYFMTSDENEIAGIDAGAAGPGWQRTGQVFFASRPRGGLGGCSSCGSPVERFYGPVPNSHFYTANAGEAALLRSFESGWIPEKTAFFAPPPGDDGACAAGHVPVYRFYNNRWAFNDSNHRYATNVDVMLEMLARGWIPEGVRFCVTLAEGAR